MHVKVTRIVVHASFSSHASYCLLHHVVLVFIGCYFILGSIGIRERVRGFWRVRAGRSREVPSWRHHTQDDRDLDTVSSFLMLRITFPSIHARCLPLDKMPPVNAMNPKHHSLLANVVWLSRLAQLLMISFASCRYQLSHVITWVFW